MLEWRIKKGGQIMIPEEMHPALMGVVPATLITCSKEGIPNITNIARVWYVDAHHVAIANHMLKKSVYNLNENPIAFIRTMDTTTFSTWELEVRYIGSKNDGGIFENMKKQYEVLQMMMESAVPITVHSAELFTVLSAKICTEESSHLQVKAELYHLLLEELENKLGWKHSAVWSIEDDSKEFEISAIRGLDEEAAGKFLQKVVHWSFEQEKPVRIFNIRSQYQYAITTFLHQQSEGKFSSEDYQNINHHYVAIPIKGDHQKITAVIGIQSNEPTTFAAFHEECLLAASKYLSQLFSVVIGKNEQKQAITQAVERICLEVSQRSGDKKTILSPRELQVAVYAARGLSNEEIAKSLFVSKRTVTTHLERIFQKLDINSRAALAVYVIENGLAEN